MNKASVAFSKSCFVFFLGFCSLLLLLIPAFQPAARLVDLPQPRPQVRPAPVRHADVPGGTVSSGSGTYSDTGLIEALRTPVQTKDFRNENPDPQSGKDLRSSARIVDSGSRSRPPDQLELKDIFIAVKTTRKYHKSRLELLIQTWVSRAKEQVRIYLSHHSVAALKLDYSFDAVLGQSLFKADVAKALKLLTILPDLKKLQNCRLFDQNYCA